MIDDWNRIGITFVTLEAFDFRMIAIAIISVSRPTNDIHDSVCTVSLHDLHAITTQHDVNA